jgi:molybdopterin-guanine dinucleotide biosynthesis protein A
VPRLDLALIEGLQATAQAHAGVPVMVRQGEQWEPLVCLIPRAHAAAFEQDWQDGQRSPRRTLLRLGAVAWQCDADDPRLANLNTPDLLIGAND